MTQVKKQDLLKTEPAVLHNPPIPTWEECVGEPGSTSDVALEGAPLWTSSQYLSATPEFPELVRRHLILKDRAAAIENLLVPVRQDLKMHLELAAAESGVQLDSPDFKVVYSASGARVSLVRQTRTGFSQEKAKLMLVSAGVDPGVVTAAFEAASTANTILFPEVRKSKEPKQSKESKSQPQEPQEPQ